MYTAMGVFITSYARDITIRAGQKLYPYFLYADTDSLHLLDGWEPAADTEWCKACDGPGFHPKDLDVHPTRLGAWKHEYDFSEAFFARAKAYTELRTDGVYETHISGMPTEVSRNITFDDYTNGRTFDGNLKQRAVPGGVVLVDSGFTLNF